MVLKLHGYAFSTCTARVATVLREYNIPFELIEVDLSKAEHKSEAFMKIQPFGQVPYIDDNGFKLYESRAIARYIATKYRANVKASLMPDAATETERYSKFEQAASIELSKFDPYASIAALELVIKAWVPSILPWLYWN